MKKTITALLLVLSMFMLIGCNNQEETYDTGLERIQANGELVLGFTEFPPFGYEEDGVAQGFDIELAELVCDELDVTLKPQYINWDTKVMELQTNVDCIWNAFTITEEAKANMCFTNPYWKTDLKSIVLNDSELTSVDELVGKTIAVEKGGTADINLSGNDDYTVARYSKVTDALLAVKSGQADAVVADDTYCTLVIANNEDQYKIIDGTVGDVEEYGIACRLGEEDLRDKFDQIIDQLNDEGKIQPLLDKYFGETNGFYRD